MQKIFLFLLLPAAFFPALPSIAQDSINRISNHDTSPPAFVIKPPALVIRTMNLVELQDYIEHSDHPLIVNFWATFCSPCLKEIPYLYSSVARYSDKGVELILFSMDLGADRRQRVTAFARKEGIVRGLVINDAGYADHNSPVFDKKWTGGLPASLFFNNPTHYRRFFDRQLTDRQVDREIQLLIAPPAGPTP